MNIIIFNIIVVCFISQIVLAKIGSNSLNDAVYRSEISIPESDSFIRVETMDKQSIPFHNNNIEQDRNIYYCTNQKHCNDNYVFYSNQSSDENSQSDASENVKKASYNDILEIEQNLLTLLGFKERPKVDKSKVIIPEAMKQLYYNIMGHSIDSTNIPKPGMHTRNANTVRSFTHESK